MSPSRWIPVGVRKQLRQEVGFGCPVPNCGNPYLTYHHFDPEWHVEQHHDPPRMIALCREHHDKAAAFSKEQLRDMKRTALAQRNEVVGRFDWMRRDLLVIAGGNAFFETKCPIGFRDQRVLWFNRDDQNHQLLNFQPPPGPDGRERTSLVDNDWFLRGDPVDVVSPPNGAELEITYAEGDYLKVGFESIDADGLAHRYPYAARHSYDFPITVVEVNFTHTSGPTHLLLTPEGFEYTTSERSYSNVLSGSLTIGGPGGIGIDCKEPPP